VTSEINHKNPIKVREEGRREKDRTQGIRLLWSSTRCFQRISGHTRDQGFVHCDQAPNISLCDKRATQAHLAMLYGIIEVKAPHVSITTADRLGQVKDYLLNMGSAQPGRLQSIAIF